jgi:hypothetical protein
MVPMHLVVAALSEAALIVVRLADETPKPEDVKAGWTALVLFLLLALAVVLLGFSLTKQLRKAQAAKDAGVYGDEVSSDAASETESDAEPHSS